jgi:hypothetical protein
MDLYTISTTEFHVAKGNMDIKAFNVVEKKQM